MQDILTVPLADRSYQIKISAGSLDSVGAELKDVAFPQRVAVISNPTIDALYGERLTCALEQEGFSVLRFNVPDGEEYKNLTVLNTIYDFLIGQSFDRGCGIIALGGGVVGDMAGFAAATLLRGVPFVQIPTTILSQVDSSVGGKTAVNHPLGKNLIGAFYQPQLVLIDIETLQTLPKREVAAGLAEVVKYGVIRDYEFFCWLEEHAAELKTLEPEALVHAIITSCRVKADVVAADEREGSLRAILNYGHTFGHAIEHLAGYGRWKHGEAVAVGMHVAAKISAAQHLCSQDDVVRIAALLENLDLPTEPPEEFSFEEYVVAMQRDKKIKQGTLTLVLNRGIGEVVLQKVEGVSEVFAAVLGR
jgi:3-dehydroquinate synthase